MSKTRVMVVDDSKMVRNMLTTLINSAADMEVVGEAVDPHDAREKIKVLNPDVLTLDIEMPKMDGLTFLKNIMRLRPMPVVMVSTLTEKGSQIAMRALDCGAVDYIAKPAASDALGLKEFRKEVFEKVRAAAQSNMYILEEQAKEVKGRSITTIKRYEKYRADKNGLIVIGSSTGGIEAFSRILKQVPTNCPPIVIVQHIPPLFSSSLADRLDNDMPFTVKEVDCGMKIEHGNVYIARGGIHLKLKERGGSIVCKLDDSEPVSSHKPSVDVMFESASKLKGLKISASLLTGMGSDGASGLGLLKNQGHHTIVQDQCSSVIWGMPKVAYDQQAHVEMLPLDNIAKSLLNHVGTLTI